MLLAPNLYMHSDTLVFRYVNFIKPVRRTSAGFGKSLLKHSPSFGVISSNQITTYFKKNLLSEFIVLLRNLWDKHPRLSKFSEATHRQDFAINWHLFPRLKL